jgi:hypothetical protein
MGEKDYGNNVHATVAAMERASVEKEQQRIRDAAAQIGVSIPTMREVLTATAALPLPDDNPKTLYGEQKWKLSDVPSIAIQMLGRVMSMGRAKYGRFNWRKHNVSATVYYDAMQRHLALWFEGQDIDEESGLPHLGHVMACATILLDAKDRGTLNDNRLSMEDHRELALATP